MELNDTMESVATEFSEPTIAGPTKGRGRLHARAVATASHTILNRGEFERRARDLLRSSCPIPQIAVIFFRLDQSPAVSPAINDEHRSRVADWLCQDVADRLQRAVGKGVALARLDAAQFAVLLPGRSEQQAVRTARLLRVTVQNALFTCRDDHFTMGVDIGLAVGNSNDSSDIGRFLCSAEAACLQARRRGHNSIHIHRG